MDIRRAGDDMRQGDRLLPPGTRISPRVVSVLAAAGHARVNVHRIPRVGILSTGDELTPLGEPLGPASIPDSNAESLAAQVVAAGGEPVRLGIASDDREVVRERLLEGILAGLPEDDPRRPALRAAADSHAEVGLASVTGEHYEGGHWLGSFATYLVTGKGR